jgi:hypothetical protein
MRAASEPLYVSRNHLEGSLLDAPIDRVLAACRKHLVTGVVRVHVKGKDGVLELRAGAIDRAHLGDVQGDRALEMLRAAQDGWYEVAQRLPDLTGALGDAAMMQGDIEGVPLIALMRHCEDNALTCTITVISGFDRACIEYRAGEIARVELNGFFDDDALPQIVHWADARYRVAAPPLDLDIEGWPVARRAPTMPFVVGPPLRDADVSGEIIVQERPATRPPTPTPAPVPARARPLAPADLPRRPRRARARSHHSGTDLAWIALAAILLLALGISSLVVFAA